MCDYHEKAHVKAQRINFQALEILEDHFGIERPKCLSGSQIRGEERLDPIIMSVFLRRIKEVVESGDYNKKVKEDAQEDTDQGMAILLW